MTSSYDFELEELKAELRDGYITEAEYKAKLKELKKDHRKKTKDDDSDF